MKNQKLGILIFAYNRPSHLRRLIISLEDYAIKNVNIFLDGPKNLRDKVCQQEILFMLKTNKKIHFNIYQRKKNLGLSKSLERGIDLMSKKFDKLIILEDDCIPRKEFFLYMKKAFSVYDKNNNIAAICGYQIPELHKKKDLVINSIFLNHFIPWGWGIWSNKWIEYRKKIKSLNDLEIKSLKAKNLITILKLSKKRNNVWTPKFIFHNYLNKKKYIFPSKCLIKNIGFDGSGINSKLTNKFNTYYTPSKKILLKKKIILNFKLITRQEKILSKLVKYYY